MTWLESLEIVVPATECERYCWLCSDDNPDAESRAAYRVLVIRLATGEPPAEAAPEDKALRAYVAARGCGDC
jgi:hypothetical protein